MEQVKSLFGKFPTVKVGVIGDLMLDTYLWGHVERISPEAPVPVVTLDRREYRIGGAGNVALNLASLGAPVSVFSVLGEDDDGTVLTALLGEKKIYTNFLIRSADRITTNKARIISRNQQMIRLDAETTRDISVSEEDRLIRQVEKYITEENPAVFILEDYNKGILTTRVISAVIELCRKSNVLTAVDPKRKNFFAYSGVDIFKPNLKEVREGLNLLAEELNLSSLQDIHLKLKEQLNHKISLITLSEKGIFYSTDGQSGIIPSHMRNIADVSGAGDTVIAVAALVYAITGNVLLTAEMANIAGGLVCEEVGTVAINKNKLEDECSLLVQAANK